MRRRWLRIAAITAVVLGASASAAHAVDVEEMLPSLVAIEARAAGSPRTGSGVVVARRGEVAWVVTALHTVEGADEIDVRFVDSPETVLSAASMLAEPKVDDGLERELAVLTVRGPLPPRARAAALAPSAGLQPGAADLDMMGTPRDAGTLWAVTQVRLSGRNEVLVVEGSAGSGNSGGPVVDDEGMVGIVVEDRGQFTAVRPSEQVDRFLQSVGVPSMTLRARAARLTAFQRMELGDETGARIALERAAAGNDWQATALLALFSLEEDELDEAYDLARSARSSGHVVGAVSWFAVVMNLVGEYSEPDAVLEARFYRDLGIDPSVLSVNDETADDEEHDAEEALYLSIFERLVDATLSGLLRELGPGEEELWDEPDSIDLDLEDLTGDLAVMLSERLSPRRIAAIFAVFFAEGISELSSEETIDWEDGATVWSLIRGSASAGYSPAFLVACEWAENFPFFLLGEREDPANLCRSAAARGLREAQEVMGDLAWDGREGAGYPTAVAWHDRASGGGSTYAMKRLGMLYELGRVYPEPRPATAYTWYIRAGDTERCAFEDLMALTVTGFGVARDPRGALELLVDRLEDCYRAKEWLVDLVPQIIRDEGDADSATSSNLDHWLPSIRVLATEIEGDRAIVRLQRRYPSRTQSVRVTIPLDQDLTEGWIQAMLKRAEIHPRVPRTRSRLDVALLWYRRAARLGSEEAEAAAQSIEAELAE